MKVRTIIFGIVLVAIGVAVGFFTKPLVFSTLREREMSYKTGLPEPRYLQSFVKTPPSYPPDVSVQVAAAVEGIATVQAQLEQAGKLAEKFPWFSAVRDERVFLYLTDLGNARFTLDINRGQYAVREGFAADREPTLVVPLTQRGVKNLVDILSDGELTYEEQYMIYNALAAPALRALYHTQPLYLPGDKSIFRFDNIVQVVIPPQQPVLYFGVPLSIALTAANVDGQWLVLEGLQGDPDFRLSLTLDQATQLYTAGIYEVRNLKTPAQALDLSQRFLKFLDATRVYVRPDHR